MNIKNLITKLILNKDLSDSELNLLFNKIINECFVKKDLKYILYF